MRVLFLLLLFNFTMGSSSNTITLETKEIIPIGFGDLNLKNRYFLEDSNGDFWIVIYKERGSWQVDLKPFETEDEALFFANEIDIRFVSIRHVEPAIKLHLNVTKVRRVVEEEIRKWVK